MADAASKRDGRLLARVDLNLVIQAAIAGSLLWFGRAIIESRDNSKQNTIIIQQQVKLLEKFDERLASLQLIAGDRWTATQQAAFEATLTYRLNNIETAIERLERPNGQATPDP